MRNKEYSWYMLSNAPGFGAKSINYIYKILQDNSLSINELFDLDLSQLSKLFPEIGRGKFSRANFSCFSSLENDDKLYDYFEKLKSDGVYIIGLDDERYPKSVLQYLQDSAPAILYCKGYLPLLNTKGVSVVGARDVSNFGIMITKAIAEKLAEHGINVTSGYAKGVDTSAHIGALEGNGTTTIILSFGVNHISIKREMKDLNLEKNALFITQFAPYEKFSGQNAMIRNKLVCAMSKAIVVIASGPERDSEGKMSGTFDAGKSALKMGIPVFVLSPDVLKPAPQGNIDLIKLGGIEFSNGMDIVKFLDEYTQQEMLHSNDQNNAKKHDNKNKPTTPFQTSLF
jgi:DNA processing protein